MIQNAIKSGWTITKLYLEMYKINNSWLSVRMKCLKRLHFIYIEKQKENHSGSDIMTQSYSRLKAVGLKRYPS